MDEQCHQNYPVDCEFKRFIDLKWTLDDGICQKNEKKYISYHIVVNIPPKTQNRQSSQLLQQKAEG